MSDDESIDGRSQEDRSLRRRFDNEIFILQSDGSRFKRQSEELDAQIRMMEKDITERTFALEARKAERNRILQKAQDVEAEIIRVKRSSYKKR